ncbi:hypothetical protein AB3N04_05255 [Alkalihalophilus sp. As8PL]|uniref:Uncharacterized protein n=1 Tax=Alkalihalophilus sp. As8PL TaxID=3237103 RepID=A0AB39BVC6_9BACI
MMISHEEMIIFLKEMYLLMNEYKRCEEAQIKELIYKDIQLLGEVIVSAP